MSIGTGSPRLAVLIDGDNISYRLADKLFAEVAKFGVATVRRLYGDFANPSAQGWKSAVQRHALVSQHQFANAASKNGTDIHLAIDAIDLLHRGGIDGFCIVSSDSDYTPLATRIREHGLVVLGFGKANAAVSFRQACQQFVEIDAPDVTSVKSAPAPKKAVPAAPKAAKLVDQVAVEERARILLLKAFGRLQGAEWYPLTQLLQEVRALQPQFTAKAYGSSSPISLVRKTKCFDDELRGGTMMVRKRSVSAVVATFVTKAA